MTKKKNKKRGGRWGTFKLAPAYRSDRSWTVQSERAVVKVHAPEATAKAIARAIEKALNQPHPSRARVGLEVSDKLEYHGSVTGRIYHRDGNSMGVESVSHHWFCDTCGIPYCGKDIDGGRCSSCMSMITDTRANANGGLENPINGGEQHYEVKLAAGDTFSCYVNVEPIARSIRAVLVDRGVMKDIADLKVCIASDRMVYVVNKKHDVPVLILTASSLGSEQPGDDD